MGDESSERPGGGDDAEACMAAAGGGGAPAGETRVLCEEPPLSAEQVYLGGGESGDPDAGGPPPGSLPDGPPGAGRWEDTVRLLDVLASGSRLCMSGDLSPGSSSLSRVDWRLGAPGAGSEVRGSRGRSPIMEVPSMSKLSRLRAQ
jgi:hypothetical protein